MIEIHVLDLRGDEPKTLETHSFEDIKLDKDGVLRLRCVLQKQDKRNFCYKDSKKNERIEGTD